MKSINILKFSGILFFCFLLHPGATRGMEQNHLKDYNILLLTIDCLRPDHMGIYGYPRNTTPNIDEFFKGSTRFNSAITQSSWTTPPIVSILTSLNPSVHGIDARNKNFAKHFYTPLKQLQEEGYLTLGYNIKDSYANMGWDEEIKPDTLIDTLKEKSNKKFFAWYHFRHIHMPYAPPEEFKKVFFKGPYANFEEKEKVLKKSVYLHLGSLELDEKDATPIRDLYDGNILYLDSVIKSLFDFLDTSGLKDKTIIILTADHGEELMEHGFIGHASTSLAATVFDEVIRVPLMIKIPGLTMEKPVETLIQPIDIMPSLFALMGIKPKFYSQGTPLLPLNSPSKKLKEPTHAFIETNTCGWNCPEERLKERIYAVRSREWKFIEERRATGAKYSLYNLSKDSGEKVNLYPTEKNVADEYKKLLSSWQENNLQVAKAVAVKSAESHFDAADKWINQKTYSEAIEELEGVLRLNEIYLIENPSFVDHPKLGDEWEEVLARAYELLGSAYSLWGQEIRMKRNKQ